MAIELYTDRDYFFHTPRLTQSLVEEEITIDAPPQSQEQEELPFLLTLGSMITMLSTSVMMVTQLFMELQVEQKH